MARTKINVIPAGPNDHPLVALCKKHGNDASDIRDAAHEIFHAQTADTQNWDREVVHKKLVRALKPMGRAGLWLHELQARAVEQIVSKHFGYDCGTLESWVHVSMMEAMKFGLPYAEFDQSMEFAQRYLAQPRIQRFAQEIIDLVEPKTQEARA